MLEWNKVQNAGILPGINCNFLIFTFPFVDLEQGRLVYGDLHNYILLGNRDFSFLTLRFNLY